MEHSHEEKLVVDCDGHFHFHCLTPCRSEDLKADVGDDDSQVKKPIQPNVRVDDEFARRMDLFARDVNLSEQLHLEMD